MKISKISAVLVFCALLGLADVVLAGPQTLLWNPSSGATSYGIEQSTDNGATWAAVTPAAGPTCSGTPVQCSATVTAPGTGLVLYRISAINSVGKTTRFGAGPWVCESCAPPAQSANVGIQ